jgi:hypothetical protein
MCYSDYIFTLKFLSPKIIFNLLLCLSFTTGMAFQSQLSGSIESSFSTATVNGKHHTGGLVGLNIQGQISNCYTSAEVIRDVGGSETVGGFMGSNGDVDNNLQGGEISYCYSTSSVFYNDSANPTTKGFVGSSYGTSIYEGNFFNSDLSNQLTDVLGAAIAKTSHTLKKVTTYLSNGWQFSADALVWGINQEDNDSYPFLRWQEFDSDFIWLGTNTSTNTDVSNWSETTLPNATSNIRIPSKVASNENILEINSDFEVASLLIEEETAQAKILPNKSLKVNEYINNNGSIIFKSDVTGDSYFDEFTGTISGSGTVISEKYYPAKRAFRMVASPVDGGSIFANWQNGGVNDTGIGTHITGEQGTVGNYNATTGIDYTQSGAHSLFSFSATNGWEAITNTKNTDLEVGKPYRLMVRGDRTVDLTDNDATPTTTTLISTGDLEVGTESITFPSATAGSTSYAFIANPYQSRIDVSNVLTTNTNTVDNKLWVWDPMVNNRGAFVLIDELSGNGTTTPASSTATKFIEPGQAFFIELNGSDSELTFTESVKDVSSLSQSPESLSQQPQLLLNLHNEDQEVIDAIRLRFSSNGINGVDGLDISKLGNIDENLASINENSLFSIERRSLPETDEEIPLFTNNWRNENYSFSANLNNLEATDVYLVDHYLGTETLISNGTAYSFSVDANISESVNNLRFALKFDNETMGIDEQEKQLFSLYPNPAKDIVNIQTSLPQGSQATVEVYNMLGQLVISQTQTISHTSIGIGVDALEAGVYLVKLTDQDGYSQTQELIKE